MHECKQCRMAAEALDIGDVAAHDVENHLGAPLVPARSLYVLLVEDEHCCRLGNIVVVNGRPFT